MSGKERERERESYSHASRCRFQVAWRDCDNVWLLPLSFIALSWSLILSERQNVLCGLTVLTPFLHWSSVSINEKAKSKKEAEEMTADRGREEGNDSARIYFAGTYTFSHIHTINLSTNFSLFPTARTITAPALRHGVCELRSSGWSKYPQDGSDLWLD